MDETPDIAELLEEVPRLLRVRAFAQSIKSASYFSRLGEPLSGGDRVMAQRYLDGLGFPHAAPSVVTSWEEASDAAEALDIDTAPWEAEEMLRVGLVGDALETVDEQGLNAVLAYVADQTAKIAKPSLEDAAAIADMPDVHVVNAAVGGAVQAANGAALALLAHESMEEAGSHPFAARHRLYLQGRWVIGLAGQTLNIL